MLFAIVTDKWERKGAGCHGRGMGTQLDEILGELVSEGSGSNRLLGSKLSLS